MLVTELGIVTEVRLSHRSKTAIPILVTEFGISTEVRTLQQEKALSPMLVTEFGISIEMRSTPKKALFPMLVTEFGITVFLQPIKRLLEFVSIIALQLPLLSYFGFPLSTFIEDRFEVEMKALIPILVTEFGIVIEVRLLQFWKE